MNIREQYLMGNIFNIGDIVLSDEQEFIIKDRGTNYLFLEDVHGKQTKKWLQDVQPMITETQKRTYTTSDRLKIARVISGAFGVDPEISRSSPEEYINIGLRKIRNKVIHPDHIGVIKNMLDTAKLAGINYDEKLSPIKELPHTRDTKDSESDFDTPDINKNHTANVVGANLVADPSNNQLRRMKIKYKVDGMREDKEPDQDKDDKDDKDDDITDSDIDDMIKPIDSLEDIIDAYDDDELHYVDQEGKHVSDLKEEVILEILSRRERIRASIKFQQTSSKRQVKLKIAMHTKSSPAKINHRARIMAVKLLKEKIIKKPLADLTLPEKERLEKIMQSPAKQKLLNRISLKLCPKIRAIENSRLHPHPKK